MKIKMDEASAAGLDYSHFGADANEFDALSELFKSYSENGTGKKRYYLHSDAEAAEHNARMLSLQ